MLSYYRARNHLCGAEYDIDVLRRESSDAVDACWNTVEEKTTLQVSWLVGPPAPAVAFSI